MSMYMLCLRGTYHPNKKFVLKGAPTAPDSVVLRGRFNDPGRLYKLLIKSKRYTKLNEVPIRLDLCGFFWHWLFDATKFTAGGLDRDGA